MNTVSANHKLFATTYMPHISDISVTGQVLLVGSQPYILNLEPITNIIQAGLGLSMCR